MCFPITFMSLCTHLILKNLLLSPQFDLSEVTPTFKTSPDICATVEVSVPQFIWIEQNLQSLG